MNERAVSLLEQILAEQVAQTSLLKQMQSNQIALIEALADDQGLEDEQQPMNYLSGSPIPGAG
ncbi:hypothetical protein [Pseudomonas ovata]|uniref:hypothetical protein n=1 Tax=Pseudomonas ovata TaxID=1839709 RepID=UPI00129B0BAE|nr:hypothetical protein [Pseudomonas ovata]